ncbi:MAG: aminotransferase class V-fold PLP-dependent enzyme [Candidatus Eremiobacteraeota bacterium]|nr:aminotransferase class V-fold PLP-dependent enzyme [Candidatus Eremiobacteraeota bacterium]
MAILHEPLSRSAFALAEGLVYLNHAAAGPLPRSTLDVLKGVLDAHAAEGVLGVAPIEGNLPQYRDRVGRFIGARADEIAFLRNTADGANVIARGLDWRPGDELVLCDNEFGSNAYPWLALGDEGVNVRLVHSPSERLTPDVLARHLTPRTRVVSVSWVSFADGYRHDLKRLADVAHDAGAILCVDAIQGLGVFPLDVKASGIDALYAGAAKWLLGLQGVSLLYIERALQERIAARWRGWRDVADMWDFLDYRQPLAPNASKYEGGTLNYLGIASLAASLDVLEAAQIKRIGRHVVALTDRLVERLRALGAEIDSERGPDVSSGIVTFRLTGTDSVALGRKLRASDIVTTYRPSGIRVSPHGYNTESEIDELTNALCAS